MAIINLRIYKGFDCENRSGCNFTPSVIIHGQIPYKFSNLYPREIKIGNTKLMKMCNWTKIRVLNLNLGSEISYDTS